jgi:uncharacterized protein (DUF2126 family)/transglutaminase-like putative cysteine protease
MAIRVAINHKTEYRYDRLVSLSPHVLRLRPAPHCRTPIHSYSLKVEPGKHFINWQQDPFGNYLARLVFLEKARTFKVEVDLVAEMTVINPFDFFVEHYAENFPFEYDEQLKKELIPYREIKEDGPLLNKWLKDFTTDKEHIVYYLVDLNKQLQKDIGYNIRMEPGIQTCEETLKKATGSCRDTGWLLVQILRHMGLAARFVSGYLVQLKADVKALDGPSGTEKDFTDLHAWAEVYIPGAGWVGLDPTSGLFAGEGHIPLACTPDPVSAAPITGASDKAEVTFYFHNEIQRIHEDPRVTKPYTEEQWQDIMQLGHVVDKSLQKNDVRLTMGGEPTFVSVDDMDGAEWNITAMGPDKRNMAGDLVKRLRQRFATGGFLHYAQGKWYPGEPLPRWCLNCYWRADGLPVWQHEDLVADEKRDYGFGQEEAKRFISTLTRYLGLDTSTIVPGYEDVVYYLWKEGTLPANVDPLDSKLKDPLERKRLLRLFEQGIDQIIGYALPIRWNDLSGDGKWQSTIWQFRRKHMFLTPGDSPMGYRLPLSSLPWAAEKDRDQLLQRCTFEPRSALGDIIGEVAQRYDRFIPSASEPIDQQPRVADEPGLQGTDIHTALCVEPRDGKLYVFMPPLSHLEHYLDLVTSIEATAAELEMPVLLEGYQPPNDPRLLRLAVTPDPGVIEVNIHPAHSWEDIVQTTTALYEEAHYTRLGTEKFMLDGRHSGTGGGNHVTIGGATPADSPILRRPDLLRSLITYWQNHPSLSYLFSGLFLGPTSQAPRVDEARDDSLYELEIAFQQMPDGEVVAPWLVDRLLRNLLIDVTGNTHRSEFCIDKLYSPDSSTGRLGLVEFRAFEMPPHARMSAVQMLLLRALIARFWEEPYTRQPVRWNTELHDRFMLPHYVWEDFKDVICDMQRAGFALQQEWFAPFLEFRFPHYGRVDNQGIELELRWAIEPWHVLGEEVTSQGTARYVDSSVERLQVKVSGMTNGRHIVTCNGRKVPLHPTGTRGEFVAGIRYKAWSPPSGLHPSIPVQAPLVFDLVDTWNQRSVGGCTYHVAHAGGRHYETFPVNANEAESRRIARFWPYGHSAGNMTPVDEARNPDYPCTLDLRYYPECK